MKRKIISLAIAASVLGGTAYAGGEQYENAPRYYYAENPMYTPYATPAFSMSPQQKSPLNKEAYKAMREAMKIIHPASKAVQAANSSFWKREILIGLPLLIAPFGLGAYMYSKETSTHDPYLGWVVQLGRKGLAALPHLVKEVSQEIPNASPFGTMASEFLSNFFFEKTQNGEGVTWGGTMTAAAVVGLGLFLTTHSLNALISHRQIVGAGKKVYQTIPVLKLVEDHLKEADVYNDKTVSLMRNTIEEVKPIAEKIQSYKTWYNRRLLGITLPLLLGPVVYQAVKVFHPATKYYGLNDETIKESAYAGIFLGLASEAFSRTWFESGVKKWAQKLPEHIKVMQKTLQNV